MPGPLSFFVAGASGTWRIEEIRQVAGEALPAASNLSVMSTPPEPGCVWVLRGAASNIRYARRDELQALAKRQQGLGREDATAAALIAIRKNDAWWALAQDERRAILEERSRHIAIGLKYLPAVARQLFHARDLGEPFDFLTWFEFAPERSASFDDLLSRLRASEEWSYVEREVEVRLSRAG